MIWSELRLTMIQMITGSKMWKRERLLGRQVAAWRVIVAEVGVLRVTRAHHNLAKAGKVK